MVFAGCQCSRRAGGGGGNVILRIRAENMKQVGRCRRVPNEASWFSLSLLWSHGLDWYSKVILSLDGLVDLCICCFLGQSSYPFGVY